MRKIVAVLGMLSLFLLFPWSAGAAGHQEGLAARWIFDDNLEDASGHGYDGRWKGEEENAPPERFVEAPPGIPGKALSFDGEEGFFIHPELIFGIEETHTLAFWQYLPWGAPVIWNAILGSESWGQGGYLLYHGGNLVKFQDHFEDKSYIHRFRPSIGREILVGEWSHVAIVTSPADTEENTAYYRVYINGSLEHEGGAEWSPRPITGFRYRNIGGNGSRRYFTGNLADVRIYARRLSSSEISSLYGMFEK